MTATRTKLKKVARSRVAQFIAGAVIIIGGGAGGFVVVHPGSSATCLVSNTLAQNQTGCPSIIGLDLEINEKDSNADTVGSFFVRCATNITTYIQNYNKGVNGVDYTRTGSHVAGHPDKIQVNFTRGQTTDIVLLDMANCTGDSDSDTVDWIACTEGNGIDTGTTDDAMKASGNSGPNGIQITQQGCTNMGGTGGLTGGLNCMGHVIGANHQDAMQFNGAGTNITFVDMVSGDYHGKRATCPDSGGGAFISLFSTVGFCTNCNIIRAHIVACNKGFNANTDGSVNNTLPTGTVTGLLVRAGNPADYSGNSTTGPVGTACDSSITPHVFDNMAAFQYATGLNNVHNVVPSMSFINNTGDQWCTTIGVNGCTYVGYNPANDW